MRVITKTIYDYEDMKALDDMTHEEAADYLRSAYRGYINRYVFPREYDEFSEADYHDYVIHVHSGLRKGYLKATKRNAKKVIASSKETRLSSCSLCRFGQERL